PFRDPVAENVIERVPQPAPISAIEIERGDVLVFLGRVLGVLDRPVGACTEPLRVFLDRRVGGGRLESYIERDPDAAPAGLVDEALEGGQIPQLRMNGSVAARG